MGRRKTGSQRAYERLEKDGDKWGLILYSALALTMCRNWGMKKTAVTRLVNVTWDAWKECAQTNEKSMIMMCEEETGIEIRNGDGKEYAPCEMSIVRDETKQRNQINHTLNDQIFECLPWHSYKEREDSILLGPVRHPCERRCKVEWGSKTCFERRGQIWDWNDHKWVRDENGQPVIGKKTCDWEPGKGQ